MKSDILQLTAAAGNMAASFLGILFLLAVLLGGTIVNGGEIQRESKNFPAAESVSSSSPAAAPALLP